MAKRALVQLSRVLGNAFVLLRCHPGPLCHPSPRAGGILQPGDGCAAGSVLRAAFAVLGAGVTPGILVL